MYSNSELGMRNAELNKVKCLILHYSHAPCILSRAL